MADRETIKMIQVVTHSNCWYFKIYFKLLQWVNFYFDTTLSALISSIWWDWMLLQYYLLYFVTYQHLERIKTNWIEAFKPVWLCPSQSIHYLVFPVFAACTESDVTAILTAAECSLHECVLLWKKGLQSAAKISLSSSVIQRIQPFVTADTAAM
jgi:hypothetical protein